MLSLLDQGISVRLIATRKDGLTYVYQVCRKKLLSIYRGSCNIWNKIDTRIDIDLIHVYCRLTVSTVNVQQNLLDATCNKSNFDSLKGRLMN